MKENEMSQARGRRKIFSGTIVSDRMDKTRVVQMLWVSKDPVYKKPFKRFVKFKAHDEDNAAKVGDIVRIKECRPISKDKRWVITEIIKSHQPVSK